MNDNLQNIAEDLKGISLTAQERQVLRQTLIARMQLQRPRVGTWAFIARHAAASSVFAFVALAGTGLAAAHNSMPGDLFYPLRLAVNDRIAVAVAGDEDARLDLEIQQVERDIADEELVAGHELAGLMLTVDVTSPQPSEQDTQHQDGEDENEDAGEQRIEVDANLDAELQDLGHLLDDEEHSAEIELSL